MFSFGGYSLASSSDLELADNGHIDISHQQLSHASNDNIDIILVKAGVWGLTPIYRPEISR